MLLYGAHRREISGFEASTTNNRMEMMAAIQAVYVKGHADNPENNRCDQLATGAIRLARGEQNSEAKEGA